MKRLTFILAALYALTVQVPSLLQIGVLCGVATLAGCDWLRTPSNIVINNDNQNNNGQPSPSPTQTPEPRGFPAGAACTSNFDCQSLACSTVSHVCQ